MKSEAKNAKRNGGWITAFALAMAWGVGTSDGALIQIVANEVGTISSPNWNVVISNTADLPDMVDSGGLLSGISLDQDATNIFNGYNFDGIGSASYPGAPGGAAGAIFPSDTSAESLFGNDVMYPDAIGSVNAKTTWTFGGFNPGNTLTFTFFASRMGVADNREALYELVGDSTVSTTLDAANNTDNVATASLKADASGNVVLNIKSGPNNDNSYGFYYLGAMTIETVPEASSLLLLAMGGMGLCGIRRRS